MKPEIGGDAIGEDRLTARLHHLEIGTPQLDVMAAFYGRALGYQLSRDGEAIKAIADKRRLIFTPRPVKGLVSAGWALPDSDELRRLRARLSRAGLAHTDTADAAFTDGVRVADPDGNRLVFGLPRPETAPADAAGLPARLQHFVVASRQPDRMVRFFVEGLGFTVSDDVVDEAGEKRTSFMRCSAEHHSFAVFKADQDRLDHHCYETTDWNAIRDWCDHFAEQHIPIQWGPGRHGPGNNLFIFIHDPDGNWVEVSAELEIVDKDRIVGAWPHEERTLNSWGKAYLRS